MTYPSTQQFKEINHKFNNIPNMIIGTPEPKKPIKKYEPIGEDEYRKEVFFKKIEFWIFSIIVAIVLGYAALRLFDMFLK